LVARAEVEDSHAPGEQVVAIPIRQFDDLAVGGEAVRGKCACER